MKLIFILAAISGCALPGPSAGAVKPAKVTLYYETLCGGCLMFLPGQLLPTYTDKSYNFKSLISKLTLVPAGWVRYDNKTKEISCQHGPMECEGNKLHGCAVKHITDDLTTVQYIACLENAVKKSQGEKYPIDACQDKLPTGLYQKIMGCYNSDEANELLKENVRTTFSFFNLTLSGIPYELDNEETSQESKCYYSGEGSTPRGNNNGEPFVPYISFNDQRDDDLAESANTDFRKALCKVTGDDNPACSSA